MSTRSYNSDGPECPNCGFVFTPDDPIYYDTYQYTRDECPECAEKFSVEVITSVSWRCCPIERGEGKEES